VRLLRLALVVVAVRLLLAALAPTALQLVLRRSGVEASWRAIHVGYLRGRVEVEGLAIAGRAAEGQPPLAPYLRSEAVRVDYAMKSLFSGPPRIQRLELASPRLALERRPDGTLHLLPAAAPAAAEPQPPEEGPIDAREPLDISSPFAIDHLRIQGAQVLLRDGAASPAREWRLDLDARGDELGKVEGPGRLEIRGSAPGMFDDARLVLDGGTTRDAARAVLDLRAAGVRPAAVAPFVAGLEADERVESADLEGRVELEARVLDPQQSTFAGELTLERWTARADGESVAHVDRARIELASLGSAGARVPLAVVEGAGLRARRDERGRTCALGFAFPGAAPAEPASPPGAAGGPFRFAAEVLRASAVAIDFRDEVYEPATELGLRVEKAEVLGLDTAPEGPEGDVPIRVDVVAALPGVASSVTLSGTASPFSGHRALDLTLVADGIDPRGLEPHLLELGVESTLRSGRLTAHLTGSGAETPEGRIEGDLRLGDLSFTDGDELLQLGSIDLAGVSIDPAARALRVREVAVRGTAVPLARGEDGSIRGLGLRTTRRRAVRRLPPESAAPAAQVAAAAPGAADLPRIEIGSLKVVENRMSWLDATLASPLEVVFDDFGLEASGIGLFGDPARDAPATARFRAWSRARELLKELAVEGTLATRPGSLDFDLAIQGMASGIRARRFQPYLDPAGLEEKVQEAEIAGRLDLSLAAEEGGFRASAQVRDFSIRNAGEPVVGASLASVRDVRWRDGRLEIASIEVEEGRTHVARDPAGALLAFGLRIPLSVFRARQPEPEAEPPPAPDEGSSRAEATLAQLPNVRVESVRIADAELAWLDGSYDPPVASSARFDLEIQGLDTRPAPQPTRFDVRIGVGDSVEEIRVAGTAELQTTAARIAATCRTRGLRAGALGSYLPAGITCDLEAGHLDFDGSIDVRAVPAGGLAADVRVGPARLDDGPRHLLRSRASSSGSTAPTPPRACSRSAPCGPRASRSRSFARPTGCTRSASGSASGRRAPRRRCRRPPRPRRARAGSTSRRAGRRASSSGCSTSGSRASPSATRSAAPSRSSSRCACAPRRDRRSSTASRKRSRRRA
jgi:hypothetical protein